MMSPQTADSTGQDDPPLDWGILGKHEEPFSLAGGELQPAEESRPPPNYGNYDRFTREAYATGV